MGGIEWRAQSGRASLLCTAILLTLVPGAYAAQEQRNGRLSDARYVDPKGFFNVVPPDGWLVQGYPDDPRGKVAFKCPDNPRVELRVLVNSVGFTDVDALMKFCRDAEK